MLQLFTKIKQFFFPVKSIEPIDIKLVTEKYNSHYESKPEIELPKTYVNLKEPIPLNKKYKWWLEKWPGRIIEFHFYNGRYSNYVQGKIIRIINNQEYNGNYIGSKFAIAEVKVTRKCMSLAVSFDTYPNPKWTVKQYNRHCRRHHRTVYLPGPKFEFKDCESEIHYVRWCGNRWKYLNYKPQTC